MRDFHPSEEGERSVGIVLGLGIFLLPLIFSWVTLRPGYSKLARIVALGWLAVASLPGLIGTYRWLSGEATNEVALAGAPAPQPATDKPKLPVKSAVRNVQEMADTGVRASNWRYYQTKDEMRNTVADVATISSADTIDLGFPYGASSGTLTIVPYKMGEQDVYRAELQVNGQFDLSACDLYSCEVLFQFDDGPIRRLGFREGEGHSPGVLRSDVSREFIDWIKAASTMRVEAVYYRVGRQQLRFDVKGLKL